MNRIKLLFLFFCLILCDNLTAQSLVEKLFFSNPEYCQLKGNVKKITETSFRVACNTETIIDTIDCPKYLEFDKKGKIIYSEYCFGLLFYKYEYKYDEKGRLIKKLSPYDYDEFKYDNQNNLVEEKRSITKDDFLGKWTYKYDDENNQIERSGFIGNSFVERWKHVYDNNNRRAKELMVDEDVDTTIYIMRCFEYDSNGNIIRQQYVSYQGDTGQWNDFFKYDENNNKIEWKHIGNDGYEKIELYEYKYDDKNNWVERKTLRNNTLKELTKREKEYW